MLEVRPLGLARGTAIPGCVPRIFENRLSIDNELCYSWCIYLMVIYGPSLFQFHSGLLPPQFTSLASRRRPNLPHVEAPRFFADSSPHSQEWLCHGGFSRQRIPKTRRASRPWEQRSPLAEKPPHRCLDPTILAQRCQRTTLFRFARFCDHAESHSPANYPSRFYAKDYERPEGFHRERSQYHPRADWRTFLAG